MCSAAHVSFRRREEMSNINFYVFLLAVLDVLLANCRTMLLCYRYFLRFLLSWTVSELKQNWVS